jgi:phosphoglycerate dehydrogenase-like enzyme
MLAWARQLPAALANQHGRREWPQSEVRRHSRLLEDQKVVLVGYGCIGARLSELLRPLSSNIVGVRQRVRGDEAVDTIAFDSPQFATELGSADHVVNLLPGTAATAGFFDRARLRLIRRGARFYNVGRGTTVDQVALAQLLKTGHLAAALLDVTDPEPLPPGDALWQAPNCVITSHSAGGHHDEGDRLVQHFVDNFERYVRAEPVIDRAF